MAALEAQVDQGRLGTGSATMKRASIGCRHPPQSGAATTSQSKVKTATTVSATSACRPSNPRCWRGRMTLSWHTGHKANGLLLLAVPAASQE